MRIVVVGATGNVGTAVLQRLKAESGVEIAGVARRIPDTDGTRYSGVDWHSIDIGDDDAVPRLTDVFRGADAVVCVAWALQPTHDEAAMMRTSVTGTQHVMQAVADAKVPQLVYASSVGTYTASSKRRRRDESWPVWGIRTSSYSQQKALNEYALDVYEAAHPDIVVTRLRPGLVMQQAAASEIVGLFAGRWVPTRWLKHVTVPVLPLSPRFVAQVVHASDLADAFWRAIDRKAGGAFNIAAEPVVTPRLVAGVLGSRAIPFPYRIIRGAVTVAWRLRLLPIDAGWVDIAAKVPVMSTVRAREVLGWEPAVSADVALASLITGLAERTNVPSSGPLRG
ncbi:NAD-dependent epimerase/dehydratase family protein [Frondihabitans cladoniiphilus]|uniref:NAD-dependent epimerase/dehydratase family protein n=1 Tax=Frondihabitans cladoniiphilus TaxID=715785 RepID=A0ABP8VN83_9MICO